SDQEAGVPKVHPAQGVVAGQEELLGQRPTDRRPEPELSQQADAVPEVEVVRGIETREPGGLLGRGAPRSGELEQHAAAVERTRAQVIAEGVETGAQREFSLELRPPDAFLPLAV